MIATCQTKPFRPCVGAVSVVGIWVNITTFLFLFQLVVNIVKYVRLMANVEHASLDSLRNMDIVVCIYLILNTNKLQLFNMNNLFTAYVYTYIINIRNYLLFESTLTLLSVYGQGRDGWNPPGPYLYFITVSKDTKIHRTFPSNLHDHIY